VAVLQYTFTHKQYCPVFESYTLAFALQLRKKHGNPSVRVIEKCPEVEELL
jgi:hypothetical protein